MSKTTTSSRTLRLMTPAAIEAAARADRDAQPLTAGDLKRMNFQANAAGPLHSPDWEQGRAQPDRPTQAYLKIIACHANRFYNRVAIVAFEKRFRSRQNT